MQHYTAKEDYLGWEFPALSLVERVLIVMTAEPLVEVTLTKYPTRAGFEITLEANCCRFLLECLVGLPQIKVPTIPVR